MKKKEGVWAVGPQAAQQKSEAWERQPWKIRGFGETAEENPGHLGVDRGPGGPNILRDDLIELQGCRVPPVSLFCCCCGASLDLPSVFLGEGWLFRHP